MSTTGPDYTLDVDGMIMPAPDAVTNLTPSDGAINIINGSNLTWSWGVNTQEYRVVLGTTYPPATVVQDWATANTAVDGSYTLAGLNPSLQYFWRIDVRITMALQMVTFGFHNHHHTAFCTCCHRE